jgi:hypothetical protein
MSPDAGQAVGLELDSHQTRVLAGWFNLLAAAKRL